MGVPEGVKSSAAELVEQIEQGDLARDGADTLVRRRPDRVHPEFRRLRLLPVTRGNGRVVRFSDVMVTPYGLYFVQACDDNLCPDVEEMCLGWVTSGDYDAMFHQLCDYMMFECELDADVELIDGFAEDGDDGL